MNAVETKWYILNAEHFGHFPVVDELTGTQRSPLLFFNRFIQSYPNDTIGPHEAVVDQRILRLCSYKSAYEVFYKFWSPICKVWSDEWLALAFTRIFFFLRFVWSFVFVFIQDCVSFWIRLFLSAVGSQYVITIFKKGSAFLHIGGTFNLNRATQDRMGLSWQTVWSERCVF